MMKVLAYCAFLRSDCMSSPQCGVDGAPLREISQGPLRLLWSEVQWPFTDSVQRNAVEFHQVVTHMFSQDIVVPFRLLSVFDDLPALADFIAINEAGFVADLQRLHKMVQMECVLYPAPGRGAISSGRDYLKRRETLLRRAQDLVPDITKALGPMSKEVRIRQSGKGIRVFVLLERGNEQPFHTIIDGLPLPEQLSRRTSGPWPPVEFLSDAVKMPGRNNPASGTRAESSG